MANQTPSISVLPNNMQSGFAQYVKVNNQTVPSTGVYQPPDYLNPGINEAIGPLGSLYRRQQGTLNILQYPSDLGSAQKRHYVKFYIKKIVQSPNAQQIASLQPAGGGSGQVFNLQAAPRVETPEAVICLYMPDTVNATYNASYDELSLFAEAGKYVQTAEKIMEIAKGYGNKNPGSSVAGDTAALESLKSSIVGALAEKIGGGTSVADINLQAKGYAINPQLQMLYRGVAFRQFQLSFFFTPISRKETQDVENIISTLKKSFAPDIVEPEGNNVGMFFTPPDIFNVDFMIDNGLNPYLPKYGDCVLTDIDVNYAPGGFATHEDGSPVQTQLNLTFKEIEIVTRKKLEQKLKGGSNGTQGGLR